MKIKICGLKTLEDSLAACEAGADFLGFNFYKQSVRHITPEVCRAIVESVKETYSGILYVGIFVDSSFEETSAILDFCHLDLAQLSGNEPNNLVRKLGDKVFKAIRPTSLGDAQSMIEQLPKRDTPPAFLLDSHHANEYGGTGTVGNWQLAAQIARKHPIFMAGGLNLENISLSIEHVQPWGVDVASGVERVRGEKDPALIETFIHTVRELDQSGVIAER